MSHLSSDSVVTLCQDPLMGSWKQTDQHCFLGSRVCGRATKATKKDTGHQEGQWQPGHLYFLSRDPDSLGSE